MISQSKISRSSLDKARLGRSCCPTLRQLATRRSPPSSLPTAQRSDGRRSEGARRAGRRGGGLRGRVAGARLPGGAAAARPAGASPGGDPRPRAARERGDLPARRQRHGRGGRAARGGGVVGAGARRGDGAAGEGGAGGRRAARAAPPALLRQGARRVRVGAARHGAAARAPAAARRALAAAARARLLPLRPPRRARHRRPARVRLPRGGRAARPQPGALRGGAAHAGAVPRALRGAAHPPARRAAGLPRVVLHGGQRVAGGERGAGAGGAGGRRGRLAGLRALRPQDPRAAHRRYAQAGAGHEAGRRAPAGAEPRRLLGGQLALQVRRPLGHRVGGAPAQLPARALGLARAGPAVLPVHQPQRGGAGAMLGAAAGDLPRRAGQRAGRAQVLPRGALSGAAALRDGGEGGGGAAGGAVRAAAPHGRRGRARLALPQRPPAHAAALRGAGPALTAPPQLNRFRQRDTL